MIVFTQLRGIPAKNRRVEAPLEYDIFSWSILELAYNNSSTFSPLFLGAQHSEISFGSYVQMIALSGPSNRLGINARLSMGDLYSLVNWCIEQCWPHSCSHSFGPISRHRINSPRSESTSCTGTANLGPPLPTQAAIYIVLISSSFSPGDYKFQILNFKFWARGTLDGPPHRGHWMNL
jgi:hypothetical protein